MEPANSSVCVVLCTCPDSATAESLAHGLVSEQLAACVNIIPEIRSVFRWEGKVRSESEQLMVIKTTPGKYQALESWLQENHPYDVPEVLMLPVNKGLDSYLAWVIDETS